MANAACLFVSSLMLFSAMLDELLRLLFVYFATALNTTEICESTAYFHWRSCPFALLRFFLFPSKNVPQCGQGQ